MTNALEFKLRTFVSSNQVLLFCQWLPLKAHLNHKAFWVSKKTRCNLFMRSNSIYCDDSKSIGVNGYFDLMITTRNVDILTNPLEVAFICDRNNFINHFFYF